MEDLPDGPFGPEDAERPVKGRVQRDAMGTAALTFKPAIKGVATRQAPRVGDAREGRRPLGGKVPLGPLIQRRLRDRAVSWEDQVKEAPVEVIEQPHWLPPSTTLLFGGLPRRTHRVHRLRLPGGKG